MKRLNYIVVLAFFKSPIFSFFPKIRVMKSKKLFHKAILFMGTLLMLLPISCKKEEDVPQEPVFTFELERAEYVPYEIAQLLTERISFSQSSYIGTIGGKSVELFNKFGKLTFLMPDLAAGNYKLESNIDGKNLSCAVKIKDPALVSDANAEVMASLSQMENSLTALKTAVADWPSEQNVKVLADIQALENNSDSLKTAFIALSQEDKMACAKIILANGWWINELSSKTEELRVGVLGLRTAGVEDFELKVLDAVKIVEPLADVCLKHLPKLALAIAVTAAAPNPISAIALGIMIGKFCNQVLEVSDAHNDLLERAFLPFKNLMAINGRVAALQYVKNVESPLTITMDYRSPYKADRSNTVPVVVKTLKGLDKFGNFLKDLNDILLNPFSITAPNIDNLAYSVEQNKSVNARYMSVTNISNPAVTVTKRMNEGKLYLKFNTTASTSQDFTFQLNYAAADFGTQTKTISATLAVGEDSVIDIDGNRYAVVSIGSQKWMKSNLKTTRYRNGDPIPTNLDNAAWNAQSTGAYAIYNNDAANNSIYGKLYNAYAVTDPRGLCPTGWHIPNREEKDLLHYTLGDNVAGKLRAVSGLWLYSFAESTTNESGFSALPGGMRRSTGDYDFLGNYFCLWLSVESSPNSNYSLYLVWNSEFLWPTSDIKSHGFSVRCLKD
jgi:uncharacterized protein (TIGR02145 family)